MVAERDAPRPLPPSGSLRPAQAPANVSIGWSDDDDRLIGLGFINAVLKILTLGIYSFWGKTEVRRRLWSFVRLNGEPLEYTGTGRELFVGFLIVFATVLLPVLLAGLIVAVAFAGNRMAIGGYQALIYIGFFLLLGNAIYRAQRYRLSRTRWRGIRGALTGSPGRYGWTYFWTIAVPAILLIGIPIVASAVALGNPGTQALAGFALLIGFAAFWWVLPWRANLLQRIMTDDMRFGNRPFSYQGGSGPLYKRYFFVWLGTIVLYFAAIVAIGLYLYGEGFIPPNPAAPKIPGIRHVLVTLGILFVAFLLWGLITAWYKATQINHFARNTHFEGATFRADVRGRGIMWLVLTNRLLSLLAIVIGLGIGAAILYFSGMTARLTPGRQPQAWEIYPQLLVLGVPVILTTSIINAFAQFRTARYIISRMSLDGAVDLERINQSAEQGPRHGEGLAQAFDVDAF